MKNPFVLAAIMGAAFNILPAYALDPRLEASFRKLDPATRQEQRCDAEAMDRLAKAGDGFKPDRVVAYAFSEPQVKGDTFEARGGAFRSKEEWYRFSYVCTTTNEHMTIKSFDFTIGEKIPKEKWEAYGLWG
jgi:hypothetical protein